MAPPREPRIVADAPAPETTATPGSAATDEPLPSAPEPEIPIGGGFEISRLRVGELNVDIAKIRARSTTLFPFLTLDLKFLERVPVDVQKARERLAGPHSAAGPGALARDVLLM